jgi:hypothetical protein
MRYRIPLFLAAVAAVIGLSAPAALASPAPPPETGCFPVGTTFGPYHLDTNDNASAHLGITYHGTVNQATITSSPGDTRFEVAACTVINGITVPIYVIHNSASNGGNCLRMHDNSVGFGVFEEPGCELGNADEQWILVYSNAAGTHGTFANLGQGGKWLGVKCPASNNEGVIGVPNASGNCLTWLFE